MAAVSSKSFTVEHGKTLQFHKTIIYRPGGVGKRVLKGKRLLRTDRKEMHDQVNPEQYTQEHYEQFALNCQEEYERQSQDDFLLFLRGLVIPSAQGPRLFDECMLDYERKGVEPFQRRFFEDVAPSLHAVRIGAVPPVRRFWMERTKKAAKDSDLAICLLWLMAFPRRPLFCQVVAADQNQAAIIKRRAEDILFYNDWLKLLVRVQRNRLLSFNQLGVTEIEASDKAGAHGETPAVLILNELVHVSKWDVMEAHLNNANGVPRGMVVVSTNAGYKGTRAEKWKDNALAKKDRWHMHLWKNPSPWLNEDDVKDAKDTNTPSEYARLWNPGRWVSGKGDALTEEGIDGCFRVGMQPLIGPEKGWTYIAGLDLGVSHDHAGLVVVGVNREEQRVRVALLRDWKPSISNNEGGLEVDIEEVEKTCKEASKAFSIVWFGFDPAAGGSFCAQHLRIAGVRMVKVAFTGQSLNKMATAFMQVVGAGKLECFEDERLRRDLGKFHIVARKPKGYRLTAVSDEHGHADVGTALVICLPNALEMIGGSKIGLGVFEVMSKEEEPLSQEEVAEMDPFLRDIYEGQEEWEEEVRYEKSAKKESKNSLEFLW